VLTTEEQEALKWKIREFKTGGAFMGIGMPVSMIMLNLYFNNKHNKALLYASLALMFGPIVTAF